jgi:hypothetical protein
MTLRIHFRDLERAGLLLALCALFPSAWATQQNAPSAKTHHPTIRESDAIAPWLVSADQGLAILGAALESRKPTDPNADCSNFVHAIYERAGFTYSYANSVALYQGVKEFRRVLHPQPGDLVVWRGHVGIVISPVQHSFFSAMRSGRGVEFYDSPYWQGRGRPRFFRYVKAASWKQLSASVRDTNFKSGGSKNTRAHDAVIADEDAPAPVEVSKLNPPATPSEVGEPRAASLQKSEGETTHDSQSIVDQDKPRPTTHKLQSPEDGVWEKTATKPSAGIPFASEAAATPPPTTRRSQGLNESNAAGTAGRADAQAPSTGKPPAHARPEPTQWAMSRYVPRPPWSLPAGSASGSSVARRPAAPNPRVPGFYLPSGQFR